MRGRWVGLLAVCLLATACSQAPSGGTALPLPTFREADLDKVTATPFRIDLTQLLPDNPTMATGPSDPRLAVAGDGTGSALPGSGHPFDLPRGRALAAGAGLAIVAGPASRSGSQDDTFAYTSLGRRWSLDLTADAAWISPDGKRVALHDPSSGKLLLLRAENGRSLGSYRVAPDAEVAFTKAGSMLVSDSRHLFFVGADGDQVWSYEPTVHVSHRVTISQDGSAFYVNTGVGDDTAYAFSADGNTLVWKRQLPQGDAGTWAVSADGSRVALAGVGQGQDVLVLNASDGAVVGAWSLPDGVVARGAAFDARGRLWTLLSAPDRATPAAGGTVPSGTVSASGPGARAIAWDVHGRALAVIDLPGDALLSPDGAWLWSLDKEAAKVAGMRLVPSSETSPDTSP